MLARRLAALVAALLAGAGIGAGGSTSAAASAEVRAAAESRAVPRAGVAVRHVPAGFRLPAGSRVAGLSDPVSGASFTLTAPDPETVLSFYRRELPRADFTIVSDRFEDGGTSLSFRDADGWAGAIFATAHRVTVAVRRA